MIVCQQAVVGAGRFAPAGPPPAPLGAPRHPTDHTSFHSYREPSRLESPSPPSHDTAGVGASPSPRSVEGGEMDGAHDRMSSSGGSDISGEGEGEAGWQACEGSDDAPSVMLQPGSSHYEELPPSPFLNPPTGVASPPPEEGNDSLARSVTADDFAADGIAALHRRCAEDTPTLKMFRPGGRPSDLGTAGISVEALLSEFRSFGASVAADDDRDE